MKIKTLILKPLTIPFQSAFKHASAARVQTQSVIVEAHSETGIIGYGESCPREYVTGEGLESVKNFFNIYHDQILIEITNLASLKVWQIQYMKEIDANPAAWCAIELALLDLFSRQAGQSIEAFLGIQTISAPFQYSAILGDSEFETFQMQLKQYHSMGFTDYKVKLSGDLKKDCLKANLLKSTLHEDCRIRFDANNLWKKPEQAINHLKQLDIKIFAIEEPLQVADYIGMQRIAEQLGISIILDESVTVSNDLSKINNQKYWIVNLRISKMGGLTRSLSFCKNAIEKKLRLIVGAQVGETSLLTRAALTVASSTASANIIAQEGAFSTLLLKQDPFQPNLQFGPQGVLTLGALAEKPGFGLVYNNAIVD